MDSCNCCKGDDNTTPTTEVFLDKFIKYLIIPILSILGIICLVTLYLVDRVSCYPYATTSGPISGATDNRLPKAEEYCWNNFQDAYLDNGLWKSKETLPHKYFPVLILCEAISLSLPLILWYWCYSQSLKDNILSFFHLCNNTTELYRKYDKGYHRLVSLSMLHRQIENCLEFIAFYLMTQGRSIFTFFIVKWLVLVVINCAWFVGLFALHFPKMKLFEEQFYCLFVDNGKTSQKIAECHIRTTTFFRAVWFINICLTGVLILVLIAYIIELCRPRKYARLFLYSSVPGCMDSRLATCIQQFYDSRDFALLSRFCEINSYLCKDIGLSRALANKYGITDGVTPGRETIVDKHFPVMQPGQIDKFRLSSELFYLKVDKRRDVKSADEDKKKSRKLPYLTKQNNRIADKNTTMLDSHGRRHIVLGNNTFYETPRLMARKLNRRMDMGMNNYITLSDSPGTDRSIRSKLTLEDLEFDTSTPIPSVTRGFEKELQHSQLYGPQQPARLNKIRPIRVQPYPNYKQRTRELDPYSFRLQKFIMRQQAENKFIWK